MSRSSPQMHIQRMGPSPVTLLVHSSGLGAGQWAPVLRRWSRSWLIPSLLGYPPSDPAPRDAVRGDRAGLLALLDNEERSADVVGHSYGGLLALELALLRPERVSRVVVHEPVAWGMLLESGDPSQIEEFEAVRASLFGRPLADDAWMERFIDFWNGPGAWGAMGERRQRALMAVATKVRAEVRQVTEDPNRAADWARIHQPVLVTVGRDSPPLERWVCQRLVSALPRGVLVEVPGAHMAPLTHADDVVARWQGFLGE